ncbi:hypothetical protein [Pseudomonas benzenivorans]|uniref:Uncharacterized protein n=1 Tax=Pseudomonas benzenivorans TaxID=556533 RepID=A0ABY5H7H8_9PSED|nr:hypothetical protein [Pseudomonas benzenivorans]UTW08280.1 hypothetical protein KDW96_02835 [Pseudomonas benzenivorans]
MTANNALRSALLMAALALFGVSPASFAEDAANQASMEQVKQETQDLMQAIKGYSVEQRDQAIQETKAALDKVDNRMAALESRIDKNWEQMNQAARDEARSSLQAIRKQRMVLAEKYGSLQSSSADAWEEMKTGFSDAYSSLHDAWEKAAKDFDSQKK